MKHSYKSEAKDWPVIIDYPGVDCLSRVDLGLRMAYYPPTERGCSCQGMVG